MKIVYLSSPISSQYGGGEKFLDDFTTGIQAEHEFIGSSKAVYDLFRSKGYKSTTTSGLFEPVSIRNILFLPISVLVGLFQFIRFYKTFRQADWIISPTSHCETFFVIPWIKLFLRKPVLFMVHASKVPKIFSTKPFGIILSKFWGLSPVSFVSNSQKELWNSVGCNSKNQIVIHNGIKINNLDLQNINNNSSQSKIRIGFLARLHYEKGCDALINALEYIKTNQQIEFIIAGEGLEKQKLIDLYELKKQNNKVPNNISVEFVGFQSNPKSFYESVDAFVFPSRKESFGLVMCEAMERGLSVICSDIQSSMELKKVFEIKHESRLVFQTNNSQDLATKIDHFMDNRNTYMNLEYKNNLHKTIDQKFGLKKMLQSYKEILKIN